MNHKDISRPTNNSASPLSGTTKSRESLVSACLAKDALDQEFARIIRKSRKALKHAPRMGRRSWVFPQAQIGNHNPHRAILELIDGLIKEDAPEGDTEEIALFFLRYIQTKYAIKEARELSVNEALKLKLCADAASVEPGVEVLMHPGPGTLEVLEERTRTELRAEESLLEAVTIARGIQK